ncbi:MAG TPA: hypothetical protein VF299_03150 [Mycobacterium sp.]
MGLATGVAATLAVIGAPATGLASGSPGHPVGGDTQPAVFGVPMPLDPVAPVDPAGPVTDVPTADQLSMVLYQLADAGVPFIDKGNLIEGGVDPIMAHAADKKIQKAAKKGDLPLQFVVANVAPAGPGAATADVTASGPKLAPRTMNVEFVDQGGWKLSRSSALTVMQMTSGG